MQTATPEHGNLAFLPHKETLAFQMGGFLLEQSAGKFSGIRFDQIEETWALVEPLITKACIRQGNKTSAEEVKQKLLDRHWQLWASTNGDGRILAICLTELLQYPHKKYCRILIGTGKNRLDWQDHIRIIEEWAKSQGCHGIEVMARNGWERILKNYTKTHVLLERGF